MRKVLGISVNAICEYKVAPRSANVISEAIISSNRVITFRRWRVSQVLVIWLTVHNTSYSRSFFFSKFLVLWLLSLVRRQLDEVA
jgi:hypothetical protein